nr:hypothetical protein [Tanacetum cinerariifolium]
KHPIIDRKVYTEGQRSYWKITRLGGSSTSYQFFIDLLKRLDREDLNQLWRLVKETLSDRPPTSDKEMELWVELSRLYESDNEDQLWTHTQNFMHAPVEWKLYDTCGVHHVTSKDEEIFMLVEKDYPLRKGLALMMISYKLQVENYSQITNDLILKIYKIANSPRQQEQLPTASEESCHCQKKSEATARKIALLSKVKKKLNIDSSESKRITAIVNKLENLGRDIKKLKENVHAIKVGCKICRGAHLDKDCPLNEEVKSMEEVKYGEFGRPFLNNKKSDGRFNKRGYDQPSSSERRQSLTEIINKYIEEASKRHAKQDEWLKKFYQNTETSREAHDKIIQGLETKKKPRTKEDEEIRMNPRCSTLLQNHLPPKEQDPGSYILPCSIGKLDFNNALADLGASINVMPLSMYKRLGIGKLEPINMVIEMDDDTKCTPKGIVENLLIKIDKFIFPVDFVILDMVEDLRMPIILGRPLLATAHAKESINGSKREELEWEYLSLNDWMKIRHGKVCKMTRERILKDHQRERFGDKEDDLEENLEDLEERREDKTNAIIRAIHDKLNNLV